MPIRRSTLLVAAFTALLTICGGAAWAVWSNTQKAQANAARLHERDTTTREALADIRSNVFLLAILARDSMLDPAPNLGDNKRQFTLLNDQATHDLQVLREHLAGPELESVLRELKIEFDAYAASTDHLLEWTPEERRREFEDTLRSRGSRRRDILELAERIETLAVKNSAEQRGLAAMADESFRSSLGWIAGIALLLGAGVAGVTVTRMHVLEEQSNAAESTLRSLSGQLRTTQEDERRHLSRELHDQVGQMLTGLRMELSAISRSAAAASPEVKAALERAKGNAEQTLSIVRNIAMLLRPSMLDDLGLTPALIWLAKEVERSSKIEIRRDIDPALDLLPDSHRTCVFRVVQEALTNASRHSGASTIDLLAAHQGGAVKVRVRDDGRGFDASTVKGKGLGFLGMEERVRELGGQMQLSSVPGRGTTIEISLPEPLNFEVNQTHANNNIDDDRIDSGRSRDRQDGVKAAT